MSYPSDGVAIQSSCYAGFGSCFVDTFYREKLRQELIDSYKASKYAVFAYVDTVLNYQTFDTTFYQGQVYYIDTFQTEKIHIAVHTNLKDSLPVKGMSLIDRWPAIHGQPFATTYRQLLDTPFVAFFNQYDSLYKIGIGPMDGCFFEPTALLVFGGRIYKRGGVGVRMAGVSVSVEDFFKAIEHAPVEVPPVSIFRGKWDGSGPRRTSRNRYRYRYDLNGRRFDTRNPRGPVYSIGGFPAMEPDGLSSDGVSKPQ